MNRMKRAVLVFAFIVLLLLVGFGSYYEADFMMKNAELLASSYQIRGR